jgi:hypothetical protein
MTRQRDVIVHHRAESAVNQIECFVSFHRRFVERPTFFEDVICGVDESTPAWAERHRGIATIGRCPLVRNEFC